MQWYNGYDFDSESNDSEWIDVSDLRWEQVGVDNDDDIDSGSESVTQHVSKALVDNVEQCFLFVIEFTLFNTSDFTCFPVHANCIFTSQVYHFERPLSGNCGGDTCVAPQVLRLL